MIFQIAIQPESALMNCLNNSKKLIIGVLFLSVIFISLSYAQIPLTTTYCEPIKYTNPECANFYLSSPTTALTFDFKQAQAIFPQINQDLITKNIQKYSNEILGGVYKITAPADLTGMKYTYTGIITHPTTGEVIANAFPPQTAFSITKDKILIELPQNSQIDPSKFGKGTIELKKGTLKLPNNVELIQDKAIIQDGKIYLLNGGSAKLNGVSIKNTGEELLHISPSTLSNLDNSVSFVNEKLITKASSLKGAYDLFFDESGKSVSLGNSANNIFSNVDNYKDLGTTKQVQQSLNSLGYTDSSNNALKTDGIYGPKTKSAIEKFQTDYNIKHPSSKIGVDGVIGPETRQALNEEMGEYAKMTSNGNNVDFYRNKNGNYQSAVRNNAGGVLSTQSQGSNPSIIPQADNSQVFFGVKDSYSFASAGGGQVQVDKRKPFPDSSKSIYNGITNLDVSEFGKLNQENEEKEREFLASLDSNVGFNREMQGNEWKKTSISGLKEEGLWVASGLTQAQASSNEGIYFTGAGESRKTASAHTLGLAVDISNNAAGTQSYNDWKNLDSASYETKYGFPKDAIRIDDEVKRPSGSASWTGPHYHVQVQNPEEIREYIETHSSSNLVLAKN